MKRYQQLLFAMEPEYLNCILTTPSLIDKKEIISNNSTMTCSLNSDSNLNSSSKEDIQSRLIDLINRIDIVTLGPLNNYVGEVVDRMDPFLISNVLSCVKVSQGNEKFSDILLNLFLTYPKHVYEFVYYISTQIDVNECNFRVPLLLVCFELLRQICKTETLRQRSSLFRSSNIRSPYRCSHMTASDLIDLKNSILMILIWQEQLSEVISLLLKDEYLDSLLALLRRLLLSCNYLLSRNILVDSKHHVFPPLLPDPTTLVPSLSLLIGHVEEVGLPLHLTSISNEPRLKDDDNALNHNTLKALQQNRWTTVFMAVSDTKERLKMRADSSLLSPISTVITHVNNILDDLEALCQK